MRGIFCSEGDTVTVVNKTIDLTQLSETETSVSGGAIEIPSFFRKSGYQGYKIFLDRYTLKAPKGKGSVGDIVLAVVTPDPKWPVKESAIVDSIDEGLLDTSYVNEDPLYPRARDLESPFMLTIE